MPFKREVPICPTHLISLSLLKLNLSQQPFTIVKGKSCQAPEKAVEQSSNQHAKNHFLVTFDRIGKEARDKGITEKILAGLLADES